MPAPVLTHDTSAPVHSFVPKFHPRRHSAPRGQAHGIVSSHAAPKDLSAGSVAYPADDFLLEGATRASLRPRSFCPPLCEPTQPGSGPCMAQEELPGWREIWQSHLCPEQQILLGDATRIESNVFWVELRDACAGGDGAVRPLMAAKRHAIEPTSSPALRRLLGQPKSLLPLMGLAQPIPTELRDAYYGRLAQSPCCARRTFISLDRVMTLHPMAAGDLHQLIAPLERLQPAACEQAMIKVAQSLLEQLHAMQQAHMSHGDIKPENILFWTDGVFGLTDFASASGLWETELLRDEPKVGTHSYSPCDDLFLDGAGYDSYSANDTGGSIRAASSWMPRQSTEKLFFGADTFALGVTLLNVATGHTPFHVDEADPDTKPLYRRGSLWKGLYNDIVTFGRGSCAEPTTGRWAQVLSEPDRRYTASWLDAFRTLRLRAPALVPLVIPMLHPEPQHRPDAQSLLAGFNAWVSQRAPSANQLSRWLSEVVKTELALSYTTISRQPHDWAPVRLRRHTVGTWSPRAHHRNQVLGLDAERRSRVTAAYWGLRDGLLFSAARGGAPQSPHVWSADSQSLPVSPGRSMTRSSSVISMVSVTSDVSSLMSLGD